MNDIAALGPRLRETSLPLLLVAVTTAVSIMAAGLLVIDGADRRPHAVATTAAGTASDPHAKNL